MLLPIELLEPLGSGAVGKLYIATKPVHCELFLQASTHLILDQQPGLVLVRDDDGPGALEPRLPVHLHGELLGAVEGELGDAALGDAPVLDPQDLGGGHLGHARDPHHL